MTNEKNDVAVEEKKKRLRNKASGIASVSFLIYLLDRLGDLIYDAFINGFFGKIFTAYTKLQRHFTSSLSGKVLFKKHRVRKLFRGVRRFLADTIDTSIFVNKVKKILDYFCCAPLHFYGNFTLFFGIYTIVVYLIKLFLPSTGTADSSYLTVGGLLILVSVPALFSKVSLVFALKKSVVTRMVFVGGLGFSEETLDSKRVKIKGKGNFMLLLGLVAGFMTFVIHPLAILTAIFLLIMICLVAAAPEVGVLLTIAFLPFFSILESPTVILCLAIGVTAVSYLIKLIRGKRVFNIEILDVFILLFGALIITSSIFSAGGENSFAEACITVFLLLGYFLVANLMRTEVWVKRCVFALIGSSSIVAIAGVAQYFFGEASGEWLDLSLFSDIRLRVTAFFDNPNMLSVFIVLVFPFLLAAFCLSNHSNEKTLSLFAIAAFVMCTVFTWSRGAWLAMLVGALVFFIVYKRKTFRIFGAALLIIPMLPIVLPDSVIDRLLSITNLSDSSISYRIYTWKGSLEMIKEHLFSGIGFGNEAFKTVYPQYAYAGMEAAEHSHSLILQVLLGTGIIGVILLSAIIFLACQKLFEYIRSPESKTSKIYAIATIASVVSAMVMGIFDYIWYNYRVFYVFWVIIAIGCAFVRVGNYELNRKQDTMQDSE